MPFQILATLLLLLQLSRFSRVRLCATPETAALQAPPSLEFSRQEHWSGVAISFSNAWKWKVKAKSFSRVRLLATPWTAAYQAPPPMGFARQEYWSGVPLPSPTVVTTRQNKIWSVFYHPGKLPHAAFQSIFNCLSPQRQWFSDFYHHISIFYVLILQWKNIVCILFFLFIAE